MLYETIAFPDNAPLQCSIVEVEEYPFHMHDDVLEIMFALEGSFELTVVNNVLDMKAGDIYVSCPRELHRLCAYPHTRGTVMLLHINVEAYRAEFPDLRTYQFANSALENNTAGIQMLGSYLKKQLPRLLDRTGTETAAYREVGEKILNTLIKEFQCYYLGSGFPEFNNAYKGNELQLRRIRRITDYIYRNYNKPIRIEDVAAMLLEGGKGLQTIAYECGFSKYKYFSDGFEKSFRTTPQQYRRRYQSRTIRRALTRTTTNFKDRQVLRRQHLPVPLCTFRGTHVPNHANVRVVDLHSLPRMFGPLHILLMHHDFLNEQPQQFRRQFLDVGVAPGF